MKRLEAEIKKLKKELVQLKKDKIANDLRSATVKRSTTERNIYDENVRKIQIQKLLGEKKWKMVLKLLNTRSYKNSAVGVSDM